MDFDLERVCAPAGHILTFDCMLTNRKTTDNGSRAVRLVVGVNGELSYVIAHGNEEELFAVNQLTGAVTVARRLDAVCGRSFRLVLTVKDQGSPERVAVADLTVAVNATSETSAASAVARHGMLCTQQLTV